MVWLTVSLNDNKSETIFFFCFSSNFFFAKSDSEDSGLGGCPTLTFDTLIEGVLTFKKNNRLFF